MNLIELASGQLVSLEAAGVTDLGHLNSTEAKHRIASTLGKLSEEVTYSDVRTYAAQQSKTVATVLSSLPHSKASKEKLVSYEEIKSIANTIAAMEASKGRTNDGNVEYPLVEHLMEEHASDLQPLSVVAASVTTEVAFYSRDWDHYLIVGVAMDNGEWIIKYWESNSLSRVSSTRDVRLSSETVSLIHRRSDLADNAIVATFTSSKSNLGEDEQGRYSQASDSAASSVVMYRVSAPTPSILICVD